MRTSLVTFGALAALASIGCTAKQEAANKPDTAAPAAATTTATADPAAARQGIDSGNARFTSGMMKGDAAGMASTYAEDAVVLAPNQKPVQGKAEIEKMFGSMLSGMSVPSARLNTTDVIVSGDYAIETGSYDMTFKPKNGKAMPDHGKYLTVWKKQADGSYKLIRDMWNTDAPTK